MRNLKKILALVMALAMSMSLVTIANAADFTDNDDISYEEAAEVMSAIGVIEGFEDGSFDPDGTLTREQAAKLVTYMLLGSNADRLGVEGSTFKDVAATRWSASAIEYCASLGLIDGAGDGNFYPAGQLTANAFAKVLLTALGYSSEKEGMTGASWSVNVAALAMEVGLDDGIENLSWNAVLTREEAAQMALNAICAPLVAYENDVTIVVGDTPVSFGSGDAYYITTTLAREQRISDAQLSNSKEYTVEFGEKYFPDLRLVDDPDEFQRPCHTWVYENEEIGSYVDYDLLLETYTEAVTGQDLYNLLGRSTIEDYAIYYYVDGAVSDVIRGSNMIRTNTRDYTTTGNGVLTQVFVDHAANDGDGEIVITSVNTYLAQVTADYNESRETLSLDVKQDDGYSVNNTVSVNDVAGIEDYKEDDYVLVNVALASNNKYDIVRINDPEVMTDCKITKYSDGSYVVTGGDQYDYAEKIVLDDLDSYNNDALKNYTYTLYLDQYGYVAGVEEYEGEANYVFITGYDRSKSALSTKTSTAAAIFLDGTMTEIQVDVTATNDKIADHETANGDSHTNDKFKDANVSEHNKWYTYTTSAKSGTTVYTLSPVDNIVNVDGAGQSINASSVRLSNGNRAYGNDDSVYITVDTDDVSDDTGRAISKVTGTYTGVQDVDLLVTNAGSGTSHGSGTLYDNGLTSKTGIFAVYDEDLYIIGAVVVGEDAYNTDNYAYAIKSASNEYIDDGDYTYWDFTAVVDGEIKTLTVKDEYGSVIDTIAGQVGKANIAENGLFRLTYDADGYVIDAELCTDSNLGGNKVYDNTDYTNGNDVDPDVYSVYEVRHTKVADLYAVGRTLYVNNKANDAGLTLATDAPIIVVQVETYSDGTSSLIYDVYSTISQALNTLADSSKYMGEVAAVLNERGTAEFLVLKSVTTVGVITDNPDQGGNTGTGAVSGVDDVLKVASGIGDTALDAFVKSKPDGLYQVIGDKRSDMINGTAEDYIYIKFTAPTAGAETQLVITDKSGALVYSEGWTGSITAGPHMYYIQVTGTPMHNAGSGITSALARGTYYYTVTSGTEVDTGSFTIR